MLQGITQSQCFRGTSSNKSCHRVSLLIEMNSDLYQHKYMYYQSEVTYLTVNITVVAIVNELLNKRTPFPDKFCSVMNVSLYNKRARRSF